MGITVVERSGEWKVVFKIENVAEFFRMSNERLDENGILIEAGNCTLNDGTHIPAIWKYSFAQAATGYSNCNWIGGFLALHRPGPTDVKSAKASFSVSLSSGGKLITFITTEQIEFAGLTNKFGAWDRNTLISDFDLRHQMKGSGSDVLEVTVLIKVFSNHAFDSAVSWQLQLKGQMTSDLAKILASGDGADVKIRVPKEIGGELGASDYTRKVHKIFLKARSSVFATMFANESTMIEAQTGEVVIKDLSPKGLDIFLHYLYTGEVLQDWIHFVPELVNAAEKYDCGELKQYCGDNISKAVSTSYAMELYKLAKLHGLTDAAETIMGFILKNTRAVIDQAVGGCN